MVAYAYAKKPYTALFCLLLPIYFARLCWKGSSNKEYFLRWSERLGYSSELPLKINQSSGFMLFRGRSKCLHAFIEGLNY